MINVKLILLFSVFMLGCSRSSFESFKIEFLENSYGYKNPIELAFRNKTDFIICNFSKGDIVDVVGVGYSKEAAFYTVYCPHSQEKVYVFRVHTERV